MLGDIYEYIFLESEAAGMMMLQEKVQSHVKELLQHIKSYLTIGKRVSGFATMLSKPKKIDHHELVKHLRDASRSTEQLANTILAIMVGSVELSLAFTNAANLYLGSGNEEKLFSVATDQKTSLNGYALEALRLDPPFQGVYRTASNDQTLSGLNLSKDTRVFLDVATAGLDKETFPEPETVNLSRASETYLPGNTCYRCLGEPLTVKIVGEVLRAVFGIEKVHRAPGQSGLLKRFKDHARPELRFAYLNQQKRSCPWPTSMVVQFESASQ